MWPTGKEQKITISGSSGLNKDDVDRMVKDAEAHAADDKARREVIDARNQADSLAYSVEKDDQRKPRSPAGDGCEPRGERDHRGSRRRKGESLEAIRKASDELQEGIARDRRSNSTSSRPQAQGRRPQNRTTT
jgi:molecular chaperone DnaK